MTKTTDKDVKQAVNESLPSGDYTPIQGGLKILARGPATLVDTRTDPQMESRVRMDVDVGVNVDLTTFGAVVDAFEFESTNFYSASPGSVKYALLYYSLDREGFSDLEEVSRVESDDWQLEVRGSVESYLDLAEKITAMNKYKMQSKKAVLDLLADKQVCCDSLHLARAELAKQTGEDPQVALQAMQMEGEE